MIKFVRNELILAFVLVGFGFCLIILSAICSGRFPFYGYTRVIYLILAGIVGITLIAIFITKLTRNTLVHKNIFLIVFVVITAFSVVEYCYLIRKQDDVINRTIISIKSDAENYEILSDFPRSEVISILRDDRIQKSLCGISYFYGIFKLCVNQENKKIDFILDITPKPGTNKTIRASEQKLAR